MGILGAGLEGRGLVVSVPLGLKVGASGCVGFVELLLGLDGEDSDALLLQQGDGGGTFVGACDWKGYESVGRGGKSEIMWCWLNVSGLTH